MSDDFASESDLQSVKWEVQDLYQWKTQVENQLYDLQWKLANLQEERDALQLKVSHLENEVRAHGSRIDNHRVAIDTIKRHCRL